ncbi:hypothetical protein ACFL9T_19920 [Thermodesulfobacteriota bacterium]
MLVWGQAEFGCIPCALATLNEIVAGRKISWELEADLKNFFGSLDHGGYYGLLNIESEKSARYVLLGLGHQSGGPYYPAGAG